MSRNTNSAIITIIENTNNRDEVTTALKTHILSIGISEELLETATTLKTIKLNQESELIEGKHDETIQSFINQVNSNQNLSNEEKKNSLQLLAHVLFAGEGKTYLMLNKYCGILTYLFLHQAAPADLVGRVLLDAFTKWQSEAEPKEKTTTTVTPIMRSDITNSQSNAPEVLYFTYGGGLFFLYEFFSGISNGYRLDSVKTNDQGLGMFITPSNNKIDDYQSRDMNYALDHTIPTFELPVILKGTVPYNAVIATNNNGYEGAISANAIAQLTEVQVDYLDPIAFSKHRTGNLPLILGPFYEDPNREEDAQAINEIIAIYNPMFAMTMCSSSPSLFPTRQSSSQDASDANNNNNASRTHDFQ